MQNAGPTRGILVQASGFTVTQALKKCAETNGEKLYRHFSEITSLEFHLSKEQFPKPPFRAKLIVKIPHRARTCVSAEAVDLYTAIAQAVATAEKSLNKTKEKKGGHDAKFQQRTGGRHARALEKVLASAQG